MDSVDDRRFPNMDDARKARSLAGVTTDFEQEDAAKLRDSYFRKLEKSLSTIRGMPVTIDEAIYEKLRGYRIGGNWREWSAEDIDGAVEFTCTDYAMKAPELDTDILAEVGAVAVQPQQDEVDCEPPPWWRVYEQLLSERFNDRIPSILGAFDLCEPVPPDGLTRLFNRFRGDDAVMEELGVRKLDPLDLSTPNFFFQWPVWDSYLPREARDLLRESSESEGFRSEVEYLEALEARELAKWRQMLVSSPLVDLKVQARHMDWDLGCGERAAVDYLMCGKPLSIPYLRMIRYNHPRASYIDVRVSRWADPNAVAKALQEARPSADLKPPRLQADTVDFVLAYHDLKKAGVKGKQKLFDALPPEMRKGFKGKDPAASAFSQYRNKIRSVSSFVWPEGEEERGA